VGRGTWVGRALVCHCGNLNGGNIGIGDVVSCVRLGAYKFRGQTEFLATLWTREVFDVQSRAASIFRMHIPFLRRSFDFASAFETFHHAIFTSLCVQSSQAQGMSAFDVFLARS
jgi:hypothetical protein